MADEPLANIEECGNIDNFIEKFYSNPPGPPGSCMIQLDPESIPPDTSPQLVLFHTFRDVLIGGFLWLFGNETPISELTAENRNLLGNYMAALGVKVHFNPSFNAGDSNLPSGLLPWKLRLPDKIPEDGDLSSTMKDYSPDSWHAIMFEVLGIR